MRHTVIEMPGYGIGLLVEESAHYAVLEFHTPGHRWSVIAEPGEYKVIEEINIGFEELT